MLANIDKENIMNIFKDSYLFDWFIPWDFTSSILELNESNQSIPDYSHCYYLYTTELLNYLGPLRRHDKKRAVERISFYENLDRSRIINRCDAAIDILCDQGYDFLTTSRNYDCFIFSETPIREHEIAFKLLTGMNYWKVPIKKSILSLIYEASSYGK
jgi:hypothetical protein